MKVKKKNMKTYTSCMGSALNKYLERYTNTRKTTINISYYEKKGRVISDEHLRHRLCNFFCG